jgi:hypothetical protein
MCKPSGRRDHKSAMCIIPPRHVWDAIQDIRLFNDKGFVRCVSSSASPKLKLHCASAICYRVLATVVFDSLCLGVGGPHTSTCCTHSMKTLERHFGNAQRLLRRLWLMCSPSR